MAQPKTIFFVVSSTPSSPWVLDSLGGLQQGVVYIPNYVIDALVSETVTFTKSDGKTTTGPLKVGTESITEIVRGSADTAITFGGTTPGIFLITGQFADKGTGSEPYTKPEVDSMLEDKASKNSVSLKLDKRTAAPVNKALSGGINTSYPAALSSSATLADVINTVNNIITSAKGTQSAAGSAYYAVNNVIDSLVNGEVMQTK